MTTPRTISEEYRQLNAQLHRTSANYGTSGHKHAARVLELVERFNAASVLDYGCGKETLKSAIGSVVEVHGYDPAFSNEPVKADLVVCTDVMEHVEKPYIGAVLSHIFDLTRYGAFFTISCIKGIRRLPDGRLAHCSVYPPAWWEEQLARYGKIEHSQPVEAGEIALFVCR